MKRTFHGIHDLDTGVQPPQLVPCIGLKVRGVWVLDDELYVWLEQDRMIKVRDNPAVGDFMALVLQVCDCKPGRDFSDVMEAKATPYTRALIGTRLLGLQANVVVFDNGCGAAIVKGGVQWVRKA